MDRMEYPYPVLPGLKGSTVMVSCPFTHGNKVDYILNLLVGQSPPVHRPQAFVEVSCIGGDQLLWMARVASVSIFIFLHLWGLTISELLDQALYPIQHLRTVTRKLTDHLE